MISGPLPEQRATREELTAEIDRLLAEVFQNDRDYRIMREQLNRFLVVDHLKGEHIRTHPYCPLCPG